jgi:hypothetical protein
VSPPSTPSSRRVRSNYLQRIGIVRTSPIIKKATTQSRSALLSAPERTTRDLRNVPRSNAPLRYKEKDDDVHRRDRLNSEGSGERKRVNFREDVTVAPIPMRSEYSDRIKTKLWTGRVELCEIVGKLDLCIHVIVLVRKRTSVLTSYHALTPSHLIPNKTERNLEEFAAENYNWRSVCPEEEMYICADTQELVHPVHLELGRYTFGTGGRVARNLYCS